jgi:DNA-binding Lrp family transcriptional regulator
MIKKSVKIDAYDRKILFELDKNSRETTTQIGKRIRKSKQFVEYRINRLEDAGVLRGYNTVIDYSRLGYQSMRVYLKFHNISPEKQQELEDELIKDKEVWWLVTIEGYWNVGYAMAIKNILDFYDYWDKLMLKYRRYIIDKSVVAYTHIVQYPKAYLIGKNNTDPGTIVGSSKETVEIDKLDLGILKIMSDNARIPLLGIAKKLKTSPQVVRNRINRLQEKRVIQGYHALIDVSFLGYRYFKAYLSFTNTEQISALNQFCMQHPNILNINRNIGGRDYEIELQARNFEEFDSIITDLRTTVGGMIDDYEYLIAREEKKMNYFPFETD